MNDIAERFAAVREHLSKLIGHKLSQRELAEQLNVAKNSWRRYEAGELPGSQILLTLAAEGINIHWLLTGRGKMLLDPSAHNAAKDVWFASEISALANHVSDAKSASSSDFVSIPRYDVRAAAGSGAVNDDRPTIGSIAFNREWLHRALRANPADLLVIEAKGDSMAGVIDDGDIMLIDTSEPRFRGDGIYVFLVDGLMLVKNLRIRLDGSMELIATGENDLPPEVISKAELQRVTIIGRVIWKAGRA